MPLLLPGVERLLLIPSLRASERLLLAFDDDLDLRERGGVLALRNGISPWYV
jgi:hypothetical protein